MSLSPPPRDQSNGLPAACQPTHQSKGTHDIFENLVDSIMAQKRKDWTEENLALQEQNDALKKHNDALQEQNKALQAQLANEKQTTCERDEWKKDFQQVGELLGAVTEAVVSLGERYTSGKA